MDYYNYLNNENSISYDSLINRRYKKDNTVQEESLQSYIDEQEAFKSLLVESYIFIQYGKEEVREITSIVVEPIIKKSYFVKTIKNVAADDTIFTGNKLMVQLELKQIIEYISEDELNTSKCIIEFKKVNTCIVLSAEHKQALKNKIRANIGNVLSKKIDGRNISIIIDLYIQGSKW